MSPRPDVSQQRKDQILDAATEVFSQKGINKARMDDIVDETGLSKGTLYWYFKSKDAIILSILDRIFTRELGKLEAMNAAGSSAVDCIWTFTDMAIQDLVRMLRVMPLAYELLALAFRSKLIKQGLSRYFRSYIRTLEPIIRRGIDSGELRQVDAYEAAIALGAIFEGTILLWVYDQEMVNPEEHIRSGVQLLLDGFLV